MEQEFDEESADASVEDTPSGVSSASDEGIHSGRDAEVRFEEEDSGKDYRRFSGRSRKKTDFFSMGGQTRASGRSTSSSSSSFHRGGGRGGQRGRIGQANFALYRPPPYATRSTESRHQAASVSQALP